MAHISKTEYTEISCSFMLISFIQPSFILCLANHPGIFFHPIALPGLYQQPVRISKGEQEFWIRKKPWIGWNTVRSCLLLQLGGIIVCCWAPSWCPTSWIAFTVCLPVHCGSFPLFPFLPLVLGRIPQPLLSLGYFCSCFICLLDSKKKRQEKTSSDEGKRNLSPCFSRVWKVYFMFFWALVPGNEPVHDWLAGCFVTFSQRLCYQGPEGLCCAVWMSLNYFSFLF